MKPPALSDDALTVLARMLGHLRIGSELTLPMRGERPSKRCQAAMTELSRAGFIRVRHESPVSLARIVTVLRDPRDAIRWLKRQEHNQDVDFQLMEKC